MSDEYLKRLARAAGLYVEWTDGSGRPHEVAVDTLRDVLDRLGFPASSAPLIADSHRRVEEGTKEISPLIAVHEREAVRVGRVRRSRLRGREQEWQEVELEAATTGGRSFRAPNTPGYYELELDEASHVLAVAPRACFGIADAADGRRIAGLSAQIYSLQGGHSEGFGDFAALAAFAASVGHLGIDAVATSPVHARFASDPSSISPYAPSTRFFLDPLYADLGILNSGAVAKADSGADLIDWPRAHAAKFAALRAAYKNFSEGEQDRRSFRDFCQEGGQRLFDHALFESLDAHFRQAGKFAFTQWPERFHDPKSKDVQEFAEREKSEIAFHLFLQWLTAQSAAAAQAEARKTMAVGLIADVAVGVDRLGSHAWSAGADLLGKLTIGAPPDLFNAAGQNWGLTTFSPAALRRTGYEGFIATLRASMRHAGGIRIDHAMGLRRLWILPRGAAASEGVYLRYPLQDLMKLVALESFLHRSIVIAEDLGTVPEGFRAQLSQAGALGMRVLWFERDNSDGFIPPQQWDSQAAALTTTHDLATVAGWWTERDIDWSAKLKRKMPEGSAAAARQKRKKDRAALWRAFTAAGCAAGAEPAKENPDPAIAAAFAYIGKTPCLLAMASAEDVLGLPEQPNLPGTIDEHPNWRRRLPPVDIGTDEKARARIAKLTAHRRR